MKTMESNGYYSVQTQAPAGNWVHHFGASTLNDVMRFESWMNEQYPEKKTRIVRVLEVVI